MKLLSRILALFVSVNLAFPPVPAFSLRNVEPAQSGVEEELAAQFGRLAGMEETWIPLDQATGTIQRMKTRGAQFQSQYPAFLDDPRFFLDETSRIRGSARMDTAIFHQGGSVYQGGAELVANAIDAALVEKGAPAIGRHGVGFFMSLAILKFFGGEASRIRVSTFTGQGTPRYVAYRIGTREEDFEVTWGKAPAQTPKGTTVEVQLSPQRASGYLEGLEHYLRKRFSANRHLKIVFVRSDGTRELLNSLEGLIDLQGRFLSHRYPNEEVEIEFLQDGFRVKDKGTGISDEVIMESLLDTRSSANKPKPSEGGSPFLYF